MFPYGAESRTLSRAHAGALRAFEIKVLRSIVNWGDFRIRSNNEPYARQGRYATY